MGVCGVFPMLITAMVIRCAAAVAQGAGPAHDHGRVLGCSVHFCDAENTL
jgi:hypothetical protein